MLDTTKMILPPTVAPQTRPLSVLQSIRAARRNVLELIPQLAYDQPMVAGGVQPINAHRHLTTLACRRAPSLHAQNSGRRRQPCNRVYFEVIQLAKRATFQPHSRPFRMRMGGTDFWLSTKDIEICAFAKVTQVSRIGEATISLSSCCFCQDSLLQ